MNYVDISREIIYSITTRTLFVEKVLLLLPKSKWQTDDRSEDQGMQKARSINVL